MQGLRNRDERARLDKREHETEQLKMLAQKAIGGDQNALQQLAALNPQYATQIQQFQQPKIPELDMGGLSDDLGRFVSVLEANPGMGMNIAPRLAAKYPMLAPDIKQIMAGMSEDPEGTIAGLKELQSSINPQKDRKPYEKEVIYSKYLELEEKARSGSKEDIDNFNAFKRLNNLDDISNADLVSLRQDSELRTFAVKEAVTRGSQAFDTLGNIKSEIGNFDKAIEALDEGAMTGPVVSNLPSFRASTIALNNAANRLGLNVIGAVTFGALSEAEMKLAMSTALPREMEGKELKNWLLERRRAQQKLAQEMYRMAKAMSGGKITIPEYLEQAGYSEANPFGNQEYAGFEIIE
jgi:hypothetical protein